jgi:hypothetical protein
MKNLFNIFIGIIKGEIQITRSDSDVHKHN